MSDSETKWTDALLVDRDGSSVKASGLDRNRDTPFVYADFARRLERLVRVQHLALIELRSGLDERSYRRLLRGELTASIEADRQYDVLAAGDPAVVWAWLPDLDEARENGDGMVEVLATAPRDGLGYMRLIEVPPSGLTESPVPPSDALQEGNHNGRKLKAGPATGDPCAEIAAAKELREIAEQIKQNLGARLPPDDYQFEYRCGVTLDFRDWKTVIATLLESRQEDAARLEKAQKVIDAAKWANWCPDAGGYRARERRHLERWRHLPQVRQGNRREGQAMTTPASPHGERRSRIQDVIAAGSQADRRKPITTPPQYSALADEAAIDREFEEWLELPMTTLDLEREWTIERSAYHAGYATALRTAELRDAEDSSAGEAVQVLFKFLGWSSGGLGAAAIETVQRAEAAESAVAKAREALQDAANKLSLYRAQHSGEYIGGMEYQALMRKIDDALRSRTPQA